MAVNGSGQGRKKDKGVVILDSMLRRKLCEGMPFEQRPRRSEGAGTARLWGKSV